MLLRSEVSKKCSYIQRVMSVSAVTYTTSRLAYTSSQCLLESKPLFTLFALTLKIWRWNYIYTSGWTNWQHGASFQCGKSLFLWTIWRRFVRQQTCYTAQTGLQ